MRPHFDVWFSVKQIQGVLSYTHFDYTRLRKIINIKKIVRFTMRKSAFARFFWLAQEKIVQFMMRKSVIHDFRAHSSYAILGLHGAFKNVTPRINWELPVYKKLKTWQNTHKLTFWIYFNGCSYTSTIFFFHTDSSSLDVDKRECLTKSLCLLLLGKLFIIAYVCLSYGNCVSMYMIVLILSYYPKDTLLNFFSIYVLFVFIFIYQSPDVFIVPGYHFYLQYIIRIYMQKKKKIKSRSNMNRNMLFGSEAQYGHSAQTEEGGKKK